MSNYDWKCLEKKLRRGRSFSIACEESGIPADEAKTWLIAQKQNDPTVYDLSLKIAISDSLEVALGTLRELAADKSAPSEVRERAAANMCKIALQLSKQMPAAAGGVPQVEGQQDLFDLASARGPWKPWDGQG